VLGSRYPVAVAEELRVPHDLMPVDETPPDRRLSLLYELFAVDQRVGQLLDRALAPSGIRAADYAMYSLMLEAGPVTPTALARMAGMRLTTLSDYLRRATARNHVRRLPNTRDGRSYLVVLSNDGRAAHRRAAPLYDDAVMRIEAHLQMPSEEIRRAVLELDEALRRVLADTVEESETTTDPW
jgi:DNA-binding MarR family transcriptional regulator